MWSYESGDWFQSSPAIGSDGTLLGGSRDHRIYAFRESQAPTPSPTPVPNYVDLTASPASVPPGGTESMSWSCTTGNPWNYGGVPVNVYVAAIKGPKVSDGPSSVADALKGEQVWLAADGMTSWYLYTGSVGAPTWSGVAFPPAPLTGTKALAIPNNTALAGDWVFAAAFIRADGSGYVRTDGKPVENSNLFSIR